MMKQNSIPSWFRRILQPFTTVPSSEKEILRAGYHILNSTTENQPFISKVGESENFRIPAFTVLKDGTLFAAADARYSTTGDGGGLDTMVAVSKDNGKTWKQSFAIWYPDSNGYAGKKATTCIDPIVVEDKEGAIYIVADMNPSGVTSMHGYTFPNCGTGYSNVNGTARLALTDNYKKVNTNPREEPYPYYMGDLKDGYATVYHTADSTPTKWAMDAWWNLYEIKEDGTYAPLYQHQVNRPRRPVQQNVFYKGSVLHVYNTGYLLMAVSQDHGETWHPTVLNPQIKRDDETALLVSPGKGTVTSDGTILIPFYNWYPKKRSLVQNASFIWSKDKGKTWHRTVDTHNANGVTWNSENEMVEVYNGILRMFIRNGTEKIAYVDAVWDEKIQNYVWRDPYVTSVPVTSSCNVTAITYSKKINGKMAVMVAAPAGKGRARGKIFTFLVQEDNSMQLAYEYEINKGEYAYSCMDELPDGSIGLLYEPKGGEILYTNISLQDILAHSVDE